MRRTAMRMASVYTNYAVDSVVEPTCTSGGYTVYTCTFCRDSTNGSSVNAYGHNYNSVVTAPTCKSSGYTTHTCVYCGDIYLDDDVARVDHSYEDGACIYCGALLFTDGEQRVIGDYTYTYYYDHATGARAGWNVTVNDKTKTEYGDIEVYIDGAPVTMMYKTFAGCVNMTEAPAVPKTVEVMYNTYKNCTSLTTAPEIPYGTERLIYTFWGCTSLTEAPALPEAAKTLRGTFYKCTSLTSAPDLSNVWLLEQVFDGCTALTGNVVLATDNAAKAFRGTNVTSVTVKSNVTVIAQGAFSGCNITEITYEGTGADFAKLTVGSYNGTFRTATVKVELADTPSVVVDAKRTYICDLDNIKDVYIAKGTFETYRDVKNNLFFGMTSAKLGNSNIYTYGAALASGEYTLYVRYNDGSYDCVNFTVE